MQRRHNKIRRQSGASLFLIALAAFLLAYLIYLGFQYCILTGGSREVRNGVDAAVLNLSKQVCLVKTQPNGVYSDCSDSAGLVGMSNINRVWGKAYLINANIDEMRNEGLVNGIAMQAGDAAYEKAQEINDSLRNSVTDKGTLDGLFKHLGNQRGAPLLNASSIEPDAKETHYPTAYMDRGAESNLSFNTASLPKGANPSQLNAGGTSFITGYTPFKANQKTFCFTPYRLGETPHLISDSMFGANRSDSHPLPEFDMAIPNAFQGSGTAFGTNTSLGASASAIVNPMQQYQMTIPHSFIRIVFNNDSKWMIDSKTVVKSLPYGYAPEKIWGIKEYHLKNTNRILNGWCVLGTEFRKGSIQQVIDMLPGDHTPAMQRLLQRAQEIEPDFTLARLNGLLQKQKPDSKASSYYIFPRYNTPDQTDPTLDVAPQGKGLPGWLQQAAAAEGENKEILKEGMIEDHENTTVYIIGGSPDCPKWMELSGTVMWRPGTGVSGCLGTLYINRLSTVKYQPGTEDQ